MFGRKEKEKACSIARPSDDTWGKLQYLSNLRADSTMPLRSWQVAWGLVCVWCPHSHGWQVRPGLLGTQFSLHMASLAFFTSWVPTEPASVYRYQPSLYSHHICRFPIGQIKAGIWPQGCLKHKQPGPTTCNKVSPKKFFTGPRTELSKLPW